MSVRRGEVVRKDFFWGEFLRRRFLGVEVLCLMAGYLIWLDRYPRLFWL